VLQFQAENVFVNFRIGEAQLVDVTTEGQIDRTGEEEDDGLYCACRSPFTSPHLPASSNVSLAFLEHESSKHSLFQIYLCLMFPTKK
jgi:hypothetical protein